MKYLRLKQMSAIQIHQDLVNTLGESAVLYDKDCVVSLNFRQSYGYYTWQTLEN